MVAEYYIFRFGESLSWLGFWIGLGIAVAGIAIGNGIDAYGCSVSGRYPGGKPK